MKDEMDSYRSAYVAGDFPKAQEILEKSELRKAEKSKLLWYLEKGTVLLALGDEKAAIDEFTLALDLIDKLYTKKISAKLTTFVTNDAGDVFYGASYERSYAHYFLSKSYYALYLKSGDKKHLQGARAAILAWDSYFSELQRSAAVKTVYTTDLMLKVFGGQIHEVSEIRNDLQISLQLYKDALNILGTMGGAFAVFNTKNANYIEDYERALADAKGPSSKQFEKTSEYASFQNFLHYKILSLTKEIRPGDFDQQVKALKPSTEVLAKLKEGKGNVVLLLEEGVIPPKIARKYDFGLKGAINSVENEKAKAFIATVGAEFLTAFAMNKLGLVPSGTDAVPFIAAHDLTRVAVTEAAIQFELPVIEPAAPPKRLAVFVLDEKGGVVKKAPLNIVSENGDIARLVIDEDAVSRYIRTGTRIAVKHILSIVAAIGVYNSLKEKGEFLAKTAAMATYVGSSKGIAMLEKADVRHWTTLPRMFRMNEFALPAGKYQIGLAPMLTDALPEKADRVLGVIEVKKSGKQIYSFKSL